MTAERQFSEKMIGIRDAKSKPIFNHDLKVRSTNWLHTVSFGGPCTSENNNVYLIWALTEKKTGILLRRLRYLQTLTV